MSKQYWIHQTSIFVITSNGLIFRAHFYETSVCFHKLWTFLQFLGFLQLSAGVTVFLKVKLKGWSVAGWRLLPPALPWSLAQRGLGWPGGAKGANADWSAHVPGQGTDRVHPQSPLSQAPGQDCALKASPPSRCYLETRRSADFMQGDRDQEICRDVNPEASSFQATHL